MSNLIRHAEREINLAGLNLPTADYGGATAIQLMSLIETFAAQGHSGGSAQMVIEAFNRLARYLPLTPLTGADDEWGPSPDERRLQNLRCSRVFKHLPTGRAYDVTTDRDVTFPYTPEIVDE